MILMVLLFATVSTLSCDLGLYAVNLVTELELDHTCRALIPSGRFQLAHRDDSARIAPGGRLLVAVVKCYATLIFLTPPEHV